ncbi:Dienelactone hydrolase [Pedobacter caeni]|uniref:Dienelactone hydrolase n=2 Tax=Pedobacter caeni TaxID=288992 RepID=A0A1M4WWN1_9SPHI|nr:Dienelactone hydrolase [Pedobacter caeni]
MYFKFTILFLLIFTAGSTTFAQKTSIKPIEPDTSTLTDAKRNRLVPIAIYVPGIETQKKPIPVILSPGYPGKNIHYRYIAQNLAEKGYLVVTIQHDLPSDSPIPTGENLYQRRLPFWETGVANILFVIEKLKKKYPNAEYRHLVLIGHSNGGDISMLMTSKYPDMVSKVISLDNRRAPFPRIKSPRLYSIRSKDQIADPGVIPSTAEIKKYAMTIVKTETNHDDMGGAATKAQLDEINSLIESFLHK